MPFLHLASNSSHCKSVHRVCHDFDARMCSNFDFGSIILGFDQNFFHF